MEDIIFAAGAQLSSYNWQNYGNDEKNIWNILDNSENVNQLLAGESGKFTSSNTNEVISADEKSIKLFKEFDKRLLLYYSEDIENENYLFKSIFDSFEFIEGTNHSKIYNETIVEIDKHVLNEKNLKRKIKVSFSSAGISKESTPFKAFAMHKNNDVLISFDYKEQEENSFYIKNYGFWELPDGILCAIYFYNKISKLYPKSNIYLTGENLGGVLAEFVTAYAGNKVTNTVVWNGLLTNNSFKMKNNYQFFLREKNLENRKVSDGREDEYWIADCKLNELNDKNQNPYKDLQQVKLFQRYIDTNSKIINLKNFYFYEEKVGTHLGEIVFIVKNDKTTKNNEENSEIFIPEDYVFNINNFLPFFDDAGNIKQELTRMNYIYNFIKTLFLDENNKFKKTIKIIWGEEEYELNTEGILENVLEKNDGNLLCEFENIKDNFIIQKFLKDTYENSKDNNNFFISQGESEKEKYILGKDVNYVSLGGVIGGMSLFLAEIDVSNAKKANLYEVTNGDCIINNTGTFREGRIVLGDMQMGVSTVLEKIEKNSWKEYFGFLDIDYYYDENGKDLIIEWEFLD